MTWLLAACPQLSKPVAGLQQGCSARHCVVQGRARQVSCLDAVPAEGPCAVSGLVDPLHGCI